MVFLQLSALLLLLPRHHHALQLPSTRLIHRPSAVSSSLSTRIQTSAFGGIDLCKSNSISSRCNLSQYSRSHEWNRRATILRSSASADTITDDSGDTSQTPLSVAMAVGIVTSLIGYFYAKCMKTGFNLLWNTIPSKFVFGNSSRSGMFKLLNKYPAAYIVLIMTLGGGLVATLSTLKFPNLFSAHDYVHILSRGEGSASEIDQFPEAKDTIFPVMLLALLTSISGFSLGPEAPMVSNLVILTMSASQKLANRFFLSMNSTGNDRGTSGSIDGT